MRGAPRQALVDEGADEGRSMAAFDHVGLADELVDAARAVRMFAEPEFQAVRS